MPTSVAIPANLQWLGFAKEITYGTPVAAPTVWVPVDGSSLKWKPNQNVITDQQFRGLMGTDFQQIQGMRYDTLAYKTYAYMDSVYQHFLALLGRPDAVTGSADPYTHKTSLENGVDQAQAQPMSYTLFYFDGAKCEQIPGCILGDLKLDVKVDEAVTLDVTWTGLPATTMSTAPTNTPSTVKPWPAWNGTFSIGGTQYSNTSDVSLDYKRDVAPLNTINAAQSPLEIFGGAVTVTGSLTAIYQGGGTNDVNQVNYLTNVQPALVVKLAPIGDTTHYLQLQHSAVAYDGIDVSGNKWMEIQATVKALMNATDALDGKQSPAQAVFLTPAATAF